LVDRDSSRKVATECEGCQLIASGVSGGQSPVCVAKLCDLVTRYTIYDKGRTVFNQGQPVTQLYFLYRGLVKLSAVTADGDEVVLDVLRPCCMVGTLPTTDKATYDYTAVTLTETTELCSVNVKDLFKLTSSHPTLAFALAHQLSARLSQAYMMLMDMKLPVGDRLISVLAWLADLTGDKSEVKSAKIPLSCREIAQLAQTTPETLSRLLQPHQKKGIIRVEKGLWVKRKVFEDYVADYRER